jgi:hypothetical protein
MAKIFRRKRRHAEDIIARADKLESRIEHPGNRDDPDWLRVTIEHMRKYAAKRQKSKAIKDEERRKNKPA